MFHDYACMGIFRSETPNPKEPPLAPEGLNHNLFYAVHYAKFWQEALAQIKSIELSPVLDAISCLDPNLEIKQKGTSPIKKLAFFAATCANEKDGILNDITRGTININEPLHRSNRMYWLGSLMEYFKRPDSLSGMAGVYDLYVPIDQDSTTNGAEECQQAIDELVIHHADIAVHCASQPTDPAFEDISVDELKQRRNMISQPAQDLLEKANNEGRQPVRGKENLYSHDTDVMVSQYSDGKPTRRQTPPGEEMVRLFRASRDGKSGFYHDLPYSEFRALPSAELGKMLKPSNEEGWIHFTDGFAIWGKEAEPPAYSVCSGANENEWIEVQKASACGNSKVNIAYDYGMLILQPSHVAENGASFKLGQAGVSRSAQIEAEPGMPLFKDRLPMTEIRPAYQKTELPRRVFLKYFGGNANTVKNSLDYFGLSNLRLRFGDITPEQNKGLSEILNKLNAKYVIPRREILKKFIAEHSADSTPMDDDIRAAFLDTFAPQFTMDDLFTIGASQALGSAPVASNSRQHNIQHELAHPSTPRMARGPDGKFHIDSLEWINKFVNEKVLGKFGLNIYNVYKNATKEWRKLPFIGAESLGKIFSPALAAYMWVRLHHSTLGPHLRRLGEKVVVLAGFETAKPDPNEPLANAMSTLITKMGEDQYLVKARFRDNLTPEMLGVLPLSRNHEFTNTLNDVAKDLTRNLPEQAKQTTDLASNLNNSLLDKLQKMKKLSLQKAFTSLVDDYYPSLQEGNQEVYRAFQILLAAGDRLYRTQVLTSIINMEL